MADLVTIHLCECLHVVDGLKSYCVSLTVFATAATKDTEAIVTITEPEPVVSEATVPIPAEVPRPQQIVIEVTEIKTMVGEVTEPQLTVTEPVENGKKESQPLVANKPVEVSGVKEKTSTPQLGEYRKGQYQVECWEAALTL